MGLSFFKKQKERSAIVEHHENIILVVEGSLEHALCISTPSHVQYRNNKVTTHKRLRGAIDDYISTFHNYFNYWKSKKHFFLKWIMLQSINRQAAVVKSLLKVVLRLNTSLRFQSMSV